MNTNDERKLQLLLCVALINKSDTQRRVLNKIDYVINVVSTTSHSSELELKKYIDDKYDEHRKRE